MQLEFRTYQGKTIDRRVFRVNRLINISLFVIRSTLLPSATEQKELNELEEPLGTSPPLELRRTITGQRVAVPHSLQSPQDRATGKYIRN